MPAAILRTSGVIEASLALADRHTRAAVVALEALPANEGRDLLAEVAVRALATAPQAEAARGRVRRPTPVATGWAEPRARPGPDRSPAGARQGADGQ
ncbi:hypothetical protein ACFYNY_05710 [Streptomyces sp. NPDC006530]|uniref:hypothetical protein n=1 Tax=Streptomyces sp. NPDC006530 TaxID=3364750 RepID=UPI0036A4510F